MNKKEPLVSIIIPVYNTAKQSLIDCILSITTQNYANLEIIVIDDGSTDLTTINTLKELEVNHNLLVYHETNKGVSVSRNKGTEYATGKYIMYVDSDDFLYPNALSIGVEIAETKGADLVIGCIQKSRALFNLNIQNFEHKVFELLDNNFDILRSVYLNKDPLELISFYAQGYISRGPYARLIKAEIAKQVLFPQGLSLGEDINTGKRLERTF